jgi:biopolymer transport protein ExbD
MTRRYRNRKGRQEPFDTDILRVLNLIPMMDILTVLVIFLLITAIFTHITIMELSVPTSAGGSAVNAPNFAIEVIVRKAGLEIANGSSVEAAIPKKDNRYDMKMLSEMLLRLKAQYPEKEDATVLVEPDIEYDYLIQIMDAVRGADVPAERSEAVKKIVLFPKISVGDAP